MQHSNHELRKHIWLLSVLPTIIAIILLSFAFSFYHFQVVSKKGVEEDTFFLTFFNTQDTTIDNFEFLAEKLLHISPCIAVTALDNTGNILKHIGLPIAYQPLKEHLTDKSRWQANNRRFLSLNIQVKKNVEIPTHANNLNWIVITLDESAYSSISYQAVMSLLLMGFISVVILMFFTKRLETFLLNPISEVLRGIREFSSGNYEHQINVSKKNVYSQIVEEINHLAIHQQRAQEGLQLSIDQATQDLRETLETVEIQNIELDLAKKNAIRASNTKSEFLANTSHELRTPLNGILGFSELMKKTKLNTQQKDYLSTIEESAKGLLASINNILDFSRLETGTLKLEYKPLPIRQSIEEVITLQAPAANEKKLRLLTIVDHDIPEQLMGDPLRLKQILSNIIANAIKYTQTGHIIVDVQCKISEASNYLLTIQVIDSGIGLTEEKQEILFDAFTKMDSSDSRTHGGTGLGLAIAKGLVTQMQGEIGVRSTAGKGATFWFTCRLGFEGRSNNKSHLINSLPNITAMIYDYSEMGRKELVHYLKGWGVKTIEADSVNDFPVLCENFSAEKKRIAIIDAQQDPIAVDRSRLRDSIHLISVKHKIPVIVLSAPNITRTLQSEYDQKNVSFFSRPIAYQRLHTLICEKTGLSQDLIEEARLISDYNRASEAKPITVLAVDDNSANLKLVNELLKGFTHHILLAESGWKALEIAQKNKIDVILMDVQMPEMDGMETTREIRKLEAGTARIPIVALTAHAVNEKKSELLLAGMDDFLSKPVGESELRHVIERWVGHPLIDIENNEKKDKTIPSILEKTPYPYKSNSTDIKIFDLSESLRLAKNNPALAKDMLIMLQDTVNECLTWIKKYENDNSLINTLQESIHKLHGGCCYCGLPRLKNASEEADYYLQKCFEKSSDIIFSATDFIPFINTLVLAINDTNRWQNSVDLVALFETE